MSRYFFTLLLFAVCKATCQPVVTDASNKQIMEWDSSYVVETRSFRADSNYEIIYQYVIKKKDKIEAEYFRHDYTYYLYVRYDTSGRRLQRGLLQYCDEFFDSVKVQIPDWKLDPEGSRGITYDTVLYNYSLRKNGIWWERDTYGMVWKGAYKNGLREGEWKEGIILRDQHDIGMARMNDYLRPFITHSFKKDVEVSLYKDSVLWPKIIGGWREYKLSANTIIWEREKRQPKYLFKNNNSVILSKGQEYPKNRFSMEKITAKWEIDKDQIKIFENGKKTILRILRLADDQMILRIINQD